MAESLRANTIQTFQMVGIREELSDVITNIAPTETPFYSMAKKGKTGSRTPDWQKDTLAAPSPTNAVPEGYDVDNDALTDPTRLKNVVQLFDKVVQVSSTGQAVNTAGRENELKYQVAKKSKEIKRDIEMRLLGNYASVLGATSTAGQLAGVEAWLETNVDRDGGGSDGGFNTGTGIVDAATDGSGRAFTETLLKSAIKAAWDNGGEPDHIMVSGLKKQTLSGFAGIATLYRDTAGSMKQATIMGAADIYVSDFGQHKAIPNRFIGAGTGRSATNGLYPGQTALILDMSKFEVKFLQPFKTEPLAKLGHSDRRMISAELTLCVLDEAASAAVADLS